MSKFKIEKSTAPYAPEALSAALPLQASAGPHTAEGQKSLTNFWLAPTAWESLSEHIGWGKTTDDNTVEQGGLLLGRVFQQKDSEGLTGIALSAIPGKLARGSAAYLEMTHETWAALLKQADELIDGNPELGLQVIGWYHTHPNNLSVFMSGTDLNTQQQFFDCPWQFAIVLNPHRKIWQAFVGKEAELVGGFQLASVPKLP